MTNAIEASLNVETMTSSQFAEMTGISKSHINEKIRKEFKEEIDDRKIDHQVDSRGYVTNYFLPELESKMLAAMLDKSYLRKITQFWIDQNKKPEPSLPSWAIEANGVEYLLSKFDAPKSMIATEAMKHVYQIGGPDLRDKVGELPCAQNIPDEEVMLEPTELGRAFGVSAIKMNRILEEFELQEKINGHWTPTEKGAQICSRHLWNSAGKSGYNYKWSKSKIEELFNEKREAA